MKIDQFPGVLTKQPLRHNSMGYVLTDEQRAWLCKWYPEEENSRLMAASGMSRFTLHRFARELGLTKSERGMKRIRKRQASHVKKLCERNGYYDSLRGKAPSEQCRTAVINMWAEVRADRRTNPLINIKNTNPRKWHRWQKRKSEVRRETFRKEKLRIQYGLERKTNLTNIVVHRYTRSQVLHRYNALRRGYFVMEDCSEQSGERYKIYYDSDTKRSQVFEENLKKDGFMLIDYDKK